MKTCMKCGKNVSDSTPSCPECGSFAFNTDNGQEGIISELLNMLMYKNPKLFWILIAIIVAGIVGIIIYFTTLM